MIQFSSKLQLTATGVVNHNNDNFSKGASNKRSGRGIEVKFLEGASKKVPVNIQLKSVSNSRLTSLGFKWNSFKKRGIE